MIRLITDAPEFYSDLGDVLRLFYGDVAVSLTEGEEVSADGLTWTFKLHSGLKFHDGTPVLAKDVVASLIRWSARDPMGLMIRAIQNEITAVDDRTFKWVLKQPYPRMLFALAKNNSPCTFIMPERIAKTDPFTQITEYIGSGRQSGLREVRRLCAARGSPLLALWRQEDAARPRRMGDHPRCCHRGRGVAERRG